jgi:hypothetical protein
MDDVSPAGAIEDLDVRDLVVNHVQDEVARPWRVEGHVSMVVTVGSVRRRLSVEALTEVVSASAPLHDVKGVYESGQRRLAG